ncbi:tumor necrosis factor receptor superfamily member 14-like [Garra rufa]|uniref:tumor necrosis factor receptor superfamily member 14-like n=1 Tax=Garra rufa TaxID=137080 RepID=UPI003CCE9F57
MITLRISVLIMIVPLKYELCSCECAHAEYEIDKQCCPMCAPGNRVVWHCTDDTSTTCVPCLEFTYTDEPNGHMKCFPCTVCDASRGLRVNKECTRSSDTVCWPLERFYCIDKMKSSCISAVQHSECSSGQYIKQAGTDSTDTVCADCTGDTYSNGSFSSCLPHTKCEALGLIETNPGTHSSDTKCGDSFTALTSIVLGVAALILIAGSVFTIICIWKKKSKSSGIEETGNNLDENNSLAGIGLEL